MRRSLVLVSFVLAAACGGDKGAAPADSSTTAAAPAAPASFDPSTITPGMLALGDSLFHGLIGATSCQACHGADAKQATVAPDLTDAEWLHSDGSWEGIYKTVTTGVSVPKKFTSVMPPYGGIPMSEEKTRAVTAYVYKLGHK
ncbi:MAG: c-type cytochrome [Gemmatimonadaceae bacterium]|nr:c-type cytochrome [Gemmatimonadaceae bacterium]